MKALELLKNWNESQKSRTCSVYQDDGYGCNPWTCILNDQHVGKIHCIECPIDNQELEEFNLFPEDPFVKSETHGYEGFLIKTAAAENTIWVRKKEDHDNWAGPSLIILAAIHAIEKLKLYLKKNE